MSRPSRAPPAALRKDNPLKSGSTAIRRVPRARMSSRRSKPFGRRARPCRAMSGAGRPETAACSVASARARARTALASVRSILLCMAPRASPMEALLALIADNSTPTPPSRVSIRSAVDRTEPASPSRAWSVETRRAERSARTSEKSMMPAALRALSRVWSARARTSAATTAKPRPCSPALAASIVAFNDSIRIVAPIPSMAATIRLASAALVSMRAPMRAISALIARMACPTASTSSPRRRSAVPAAVSPPRRCRASPPGNGRRLSIGDGSRGEAGGLSIGAGGVAHECRHAGHSVGDAPAFGRRGRVVLNGVDGFQHVTRPSREDAGRIAHGP